MGDIQILNNGDSGLDFRTKLNDNFAEVNIPNEVIVASLDDLPTQVGGIITLVANTRYVIVTDLILPYSFDFSGAGNIVITSSVNSIIYVGGGDLFVGTILPGIIYIETLIFISSDIGSGHGTLFNMNLVGGVDPNKFLVFSFVIITTFDSLGSLTNIGILLRSVSVLDIGIGLVLTNFVNFGIADSEFVDWQNLSTTMLSFNGTCPQISLNHVRFEPDTTEFALDIDAAIVIDLLIAVGNSFNNTARIFAAGSLDKKDPRFVFKGNSFLEDSRSLNNMYVTAGVLETTIIVAGTPVLSNVAWTNNSGLMERFSFSAGRFTYIGIEPITIKVTYNSGLEVLGVPTKVISSYIAKNGTVIPESQNSGTSSASNIASISGSALINLVTTDYLEFFVANEDTTDNIIVRSCNFISVD